jgi:hypothetical protein
MSFFQPPKGLYQDENGTLRNPEGIEMILPHNTRTDYTNPVLRPFHDCKQWPTEMTIQHRSSHQIPGVTTYPGHIHRCHSCGQQLSSAREGFMGNVPYGSRMWLHLCIMRSGDQYSFLTCETCSAHCFTECTAHGFYTEGRCHNETFVRHYPLLDTPAGEGKMTKAATKR